MCRCSAERVREIDEIIADRMKLFERTPEDPKTRHTSEVPMSSFSTARSLIRCTIASLDFALAFALGCAAETAPETTVHGAALTASYPTAPSGILARNEAGRTASAGLEGDAFSLRLQSGHIYSLFVVTQSGEVPVVFPRLSGKLDTSFAVRSRGGVIRLGNVRHMAQAPAGGFLFAPGAGTDIDFDFDFDCQNCADDNHDVECDDGSQGVNDANEVGPSNQADGTRELAVPEHDAPESVDGCGTDEPDGDNNDTH
jgi:hypothetical protein